MSNSPFYDAISKSLDEWHRHPNVRAGLARSYLNFLIAAAGAAHYGCWLDRRYGPTAATRGFLPSNAPRMPDLDHAYAMRDLRDRRRNRVVALVSEPYRRLDDKFAEELNGWCAEVGLAWGQLPVEIHTVGHETCAIFVCRPGDFPPLLKLGTRDQRIRDEIVRLMRRVSAG